MPPYLATHAPPYWRTAIDELSRRDPVLAPIIARFPGEALEPHGDVFRSLARAIVGQQISVVAAEHIWQRMVDRVGPMSPDGFTAVDVKDLRDCGLTRRKADSLIAIARAVPRDDGRWRQWLELSDEDLSAALAGFNGVGPWTCHMVLIFAAGRADVLPVGDIGLRRVAGECYAGHGRPLDSGELSDLAARWRPWRSVAVWYLWRLMDPVPVAY